jgi:hypothetical protein|nr:MAG TPA: hypothetical protein [Caudoviricetes sp.]
MPYITEEQMQHIVSATCEALRGEPRATIRIEPLHGEAYWEGGINGHFFRLPTGVPVEVPESLARLIASGERVRVASAARLSPYRRGGGRRVG